MSKLLILFLAILTVFFILPSFSSSSKNVDSKTWLNTNYDTFVVAVQQMSYVMENTEDEIQVKKAYEKVQHTYRKVQFLIDYISEESVKRYINGAPLPSVEQSIPIVNVLEPRGIQVMDETLFQDSIDFQKLKTITAALKSDLDKLKTVFTSADLYEADIKRAVYKNIISIYTLQLTGFDTPGSLSGIDNSIHSFQAVSEFLPLVYNDHPIAKDISIHCLKAKDYLQNNNHFDTFDRVFFYKNHIAPLLKALSKWEMNDLPVISRNIAEQFSVNVDSEHLFSTSLFNMEYYALLPNKIIADPQIIELGRTLFYDPILSQDNKMSCATCHNPEKAFTDGLAKTTTNKENITGLRNTPTLINAIFTKGYFYDLREDEPSRQIVHVVKDKNEFNTDFIDIMDRLESKEYYKRAFKQLFPEAQLSKYAITSAITAYVASLSSYNSPFDQYMRGETQSIDPKVIKGFNLFAGKAACATCHFIPTFSGLVPASFKESESEVLGVPEKWIPQGNMTLDSDQGRINSGKPRDEAPHLAFSFKTTTLRNIAKTAPYMHNGAFNSLQDVMQFYNKGGGVGLGFSLEYQTLSPDPLNLSDAEIADIILFMESLTSLPKMEY